MLDREVLKGLAEGKPLRSTSYEEEDKFECPRCYGSYFGSSAPYGVQETEFYCHDEFERGCSWHGTRDKCFIHTYSEQTLAQELLNAYDRIKELERK